ncbi:MAG: nucleotidyl transferase AbiEii/AbiGii toxin family protein [Candidatus Kerfeldbacteria bacterium]|nr:nucleotidyl transferase AbiEii/AbiGii toxin family protein [Candidatus Kerfeldbacteria bacterium]
MIIPRPQDAIHKAWLYRLLMTIADDAVLMRHLKFKGGTCAAMLGWLDRFSVDLDFDAVDTTPYIVSSLNIRLQQLVNALGLGIKDYSKNGIQYFLRYDAPPHHRTTIKLEASFPPPVSNIYEPVRFVDIDRTIPAQTVETMFANKLVAVLDRWEKNHSLAGRDIYDIHYFFLHGQHYLPAIIKERRNTTVRQFLQELILFIEKHVTTTTVQQDLNALLSPEQFQRIYKTLKIETLVLLQDELSRVKLNFMV